jgi:hypothetical protein
MTSSQITVAGIPIPFGAPILQGLVGLHILFGLSCVVTGLVAMLSQKRAGPHPVFGTAYYWCLAVVFVSAAVLSALRWREDYHLFILGTLSFASATLGRTARRGAWRRWFVAHVSGMGMSYVLLLTAFYVDNGKNLPLWRELPTFAYWLLPSAVGVPLIAYTLTHHPLARTLHRSTDV